MARETFTNIRIVNKLLNKGAGPKTIHIPTRENLFYDVAMSYKEARLDNIVLDGVEYGSGSSQEGATQVPKLEVAKVLATIRCTAWRQKHFHLRWFDMTGVLDPGLSCDSR